MYQDVLALRLYLLLTFSVKKLMSVSYHQYPPLIGGNVSQICGRVITNKLLLFGKLESRDKDSFQAMPISQKKCLNFLPLRLPKTFSHEGRVTD